MKLFLLTFGIITTAFLALALGAILRGKPLQGSCGGKALCLFCSKKDQCEDKKKPSEN